MTESSKLSVSENMKNKKQRTNGKKKKTPTKQTKTF